MPLDRKLCVWSSKCTLAMVSLVSELILYHRCKIYFNYQDEQLRGSAYYPSGPNPAKRPLFPMPIFPIVNGPDFSYCWSLNLICQLWSYWRIPWSPEHLTLSLSDIYTKHTLHQHLKISKRHSKSTVQQISRLEAVAPFISINVHPWPSLAVLWSGGFLAALLGDWSSPLVTEGKRWPDHYAFIVLQPEQSHALFWSATDKGVSVQLLIEMINVLRHLERKMIGMQST